MAILIFLFVALNIFGRGRYRATRKLYRLRGFNRTVRVARRCNHVNYSKSLLSVSKLVSNIICGFIELCVLIKKAIEYLILNTKSILNKNNLH